jgi:hypothetical protein
MRCSEECYNGIPSCVELPRRRHSLHTGITLTLKQPVSYAAGVGIMKRVIQIIHKSTKLYKSFFNSVKLVTNAMEFKTTTTKQTKEHTPSDCRMK